MSNTLGTEFCIEAISEAIARYGTPEIFNTDQGCQFTSRPFIEHLKLHGIRQSMDSRGCWRDNVFVERLWRSTMPHARTAVWARKRPTSPTSHQTPGCLRPRKGSPRRISNPCRRPLSCTHFLSEQPGPPLACSGRHGWRTSCLDPSDGSALLRGDAGTKPRGLMPTNEPLRSTIYLDGG